MADNNYQLNRIQVSPTIPENELWLVQPPKLISVAIKLKDDGSIVEERTFSKPELLTRIINIGL